MFDVRFLIADFRLQTADCGDLPNQYKRGVMPSDQHQNSNNWPSGLGQPAIRALAGAGYRQLDELATIRAADLLKLHGMGPKGIRILREALAAKGLAFADEAQGA
jgi:hypothetical protein